MRTLEELRCALVVDEGAYIDEARAVVRDLIAHVARQAEQITTLTRDVDSLDKEGHLPCSLTARVAALEASEAERAIDRMVARRTGPGRPMVSAGKVQTPAKLDEAPLGVGAKVLIPGEVVAVDTDGSLRVRYSAMGSDAYHAWCRAEQVRPEPAAPPPPAAPAPASDDYEARARRYLATLLRTVADEPWRPLADLATLLRTVAAEARREERAACEAVCRKVAQRGGGPKWHIARTAADECADRIAARGKGE